MFFDLDGRQLGSSESRVDCGSSSQIVVSGSVGVGSQSRASVGLSIRLIGRVVRVVKLVVRREGSSGRGRGWSGHLNLRSRPRALVLRGWIEVLSADEVDEVDKRLRLLRDREAATSSYRKTI